MFVKKCLSENDRKKLCLVLLSLNVIQIFLSISIFALGAYLSLDVNSKASLVKGYSLKPIGATLSGCGIAMFSLHCLGAKASNDCCYPQTRSRFENKLCIIVLCYGVMSSVLIVVSITCLVHYLKLMGELRHGLLSSMKLYARDIKKKKSFDEMQMEYRCCGNTNYTDWFRVMWMQEKSVPPETDSTFSRTDYQHSVPFSCCDPSHAGPCFHHLVKRERGQYKYPDHGFFKRGCMQVLLGVLQEVTQAITIFVLVPFFLELTIAVQTRYLQTSLNDCKRRTNPSGIGKCWLFKEPPYEPDLQVMSKSRESDDLANILHLSSSEESVLYDAESSTKLIDESDIPTKYQSKKSGNGTFAKQRMLPPSVDSGDSELRKLLSRETDRKDSNRRSKRRSHSGRQQNLKVRERGDLKANSSQSGESEKKLHSARNNSETKDAKNKMMHGKVHPLSNAERIPEMKHYDDRSVANKSDLPVIPERIRKGVNRKEAESISNDAR